MDADAQPEHEAPAGEVLEGSASLATASGPRRGSCSTQVPSSGRLVAAAATASVVIASPMGWGQYRWSTAQIESAPVASARRQSSASAADGWSYHWYYHPWKRVLPAW